MYKSPHQVIKISHKRLVVLRNQLLAAYKKSSCNEENPDGIDEIPPNNKNNVYYADLKDKIEDSNKLTLNNALDKTLPYAPSIATLYEFFYREKGEQYKYEVHTIFLIKTFIKTHLNESLKNKDDTKNLNEAISKMFQMIINDKVLKETPELLKSTIEASKSSNDLERSLYLYNIVNSLEGFKYSPKKITMILNTCLPVFNKNNFEDGIIEIYKHLFYVTLNYEDYNSAIMYCNALLDFSLEKNYPFETATAHLNLGIIHFYTAHYISCTEHWKIVIAFSTECLHSILETNVIKGKELLMTCYSYTASYYLALGNDIDAMTFCNKAIILARELEKKKDLGTLLFKMASINTLPNNIGSGSWKTYINEALGIFKGIEDTLWLSECFNLLVHAEEGAYYEKGHTHQIAFNDGWENASENPQLFFDLVKIAHDNNDISGAKQNLDLIIEKFKNNPRVLAEAYRQHIIIAIGTDNVGEISDYFNLQIKSLEEAYNLNIPKLDKSIILKNLGAAYCNIEKYSKGFQNLFLALDFFESMGNVFETAETRYLIGRAKMRTGEYDEALEEFVKAEDGLKPSFYYDLDITIKINLCSVYYSLNKFDLAEKYLKKCRALNEEFKLQRNEEIEELSKNIEKTK